MEVSIGKMEGVASASVNFMSQKLKIETERRGSIKKLYPRIEQIVKEIEPQVEIEAWEKETEEEGLDKKEYIPLIAGAVLYFFGLLYPSEGTVRLGIFLAAYALVGGEVLWRAVQNIRRGQVFDENFLMAVATIGAFAVGEYPEGVAVMLFYQVGELFQDVAVHRSRKSISSLMEIRPEYANLVQGEEILQTAPEEIKVGDIILIKPGERVPLDGEVIEGVSSLDTSAITGESLPRDVESGSKILSGMINKNGLLKVKVEKIYADSTIAKILDLVENAGSKKAPTEKFITKFAAVYTPAVVFIALALAILPPIILGESFSTWVYRALIFLVVSCPCALVISIPLGFFGGIGGASKNGILIKGGNYLEALNQVTTIVFDKTGTLTKGNFKVTKIETEGKYSEKELLEFAALGESYSTHPIALSILEANGPVEKGKIENYEEVPGHGIQFRVGGKKIAVGNEKILRRNGISFEKPEGIGTVLYISVDQKFEGHILISDEMKEDSAEAIRDLRKEGIRNLVMLTGDSRLVGEKIGEELGLDTVYSELLPDQKVEKLEEVFKGLGTKEKLAFVGDGVNDAPVIARADIGIAMGAMGSDAAIEASDIVIMTDEPSKIVSALKIAKKTKKIVMQNIFLAMIIKVVVLILGAGGMATMWEAVFADVGVAVLAILNAMRVLNTKDI